MIVISLNLIMMKLNNKITIQILQCPKFINNQGNEKTDYCYSGANVAYFCIMQQKNKKFNGER